MKLILSEIVMDLAGKPVEDENKKILSYRDLFMRALLNFLATDKDLGGEEKFKNYQLAQKVANEGETEFTVDELARVQKRSDTMFSTLLVGRIRDYINNKSETKD